MAMAFLGILTLMGVLLLGTGINGMIVASETVRPLCSMQSDCPEGQVCCLFSGEDAGVCHTADMCDEVTAITQREKEANIQTPMSQDNVGNFHLEAILGGLIVLLAILAVVYLIQHKRLLASEKHVTK